MNRAPGDDDIGCEVMAESDW